MRSSAGENSRLAGYYRLHSKIYDSTRWSFLHGRWALVELLAAQGRPNRILEVGCGTGTNLLHLARLFPELERSVREMQDCIRSA